MDAPATSRPAVPHAIDERCLYRAATAAKILGLGRYGMRRAKRAGLRIVRFGRGDFILGADLIEFFARLGREEGDE